MARIRYSQDRTNVRREHPANAIGPLYYSPALIDQSNYTHIDYITNFGKLVLEFQELLDISSIGIRLGTNSYGSTNVIVEASEDSTNGIDGSWTEVINETVQLATYATHSFTATSAKWLKFSAPTYSATGIQLYDFFIYGDYQVPISLTFDEEIDDSLALVDSPNSGPAIYLTDISPATSFTAGGITGYSPVSYVFTDQIQDPSSRGMLLTLTASIRFFAAQHDYTALNAGFYFAYEGDQYWCMIFGDTVKITKNGIVQSITDFSVGHYETYAIIVYISTLGSIDLYINGELQCTVSGWNTTTGGVYTIGYGHTHSPYANNHVNIEDIIVADSIDESAMPYESFTYYEDADDSLALGCISAVNKVFKLAENDSLNIVTTPIGSIGLLLRDWLFTATTLSSCWKGTDTIADVLLINEKFTIGFNKPITDSFAATDATSRALGLPVKDFLFATCTVDSSGRFQRAIADLLTVFPIASLYNFALLDLADSVAATDSNVSNVGALLTEYLSAVDASGASGKFNRAVSDALLALDAAIHGRGYSALLSDTIGTSEALIALVWVICSASDAVAAVDAVTPLKTSLPVLADSLTIATTASNRGSLKEMLADSVSFRITLVLGGETYQCWSFTGDEMFASLYSNYGFNSFASLGGKDYGCNATGIYLLEGDDDAGTAIESGIRVNYSNFGTHQKKRLYHAFFGLSGSDPVLKVITDNGEAEYYVVGNKAHIAKGLCGANWELILTGIDDLDFIEITPVILSR